MRNLTELEKIAINKMAKAIDCDWFELSVDDYGDDCVYDKDENKKIKLEKGLVEMESYNLDVVFFIDRAMSEFWTFKEINFKIRLSSECDNEIPKTKAMQKDFLSKFKTINEIKSIITKEEYEAYRKVIDEARKCKCFSYDRLWKLAKGMQLFIEENEKCTLLDGKVKNRLQLTEREYRMFKRRD